MPSRRDPATGKTRRGTSNSDDRGSARARRARKRWLLAEFGDGRVAPCSFGCGTKLTFETLTVDRHPVPGCEGGTYRKGNIRPACGGCNTDHGCRLRSGLDKQARRMV